MFAAHVVCVVLCIMEYFSELFLPLFLAVGVSRCPAWLKHVQWMVQKVSKCCVFVGK